jgi:hypothetical protein
MNRFSLEIAMHDGRACAALVPVGVSGVQTGRDLPEQLQRICAAERAALLNPAGQGLAVEQLHDQIRGLAAFVEARIAHVHDVLAVDPRSDAGLQLELLARAGDGHDLRPEQLERDTPLGARVLGLEDRAHAALGEQADHAIADGKDLARFEQGRTNISRVPGLARGQQKGGCRPRGAPHADARRAFTCRDAWRRCEDSAHSGRGG